MTPSDFSKGLLRSAKGDEPLPGAKTRAFAQVEVALASSLATATSSASTAQRGGENMPSSVAPPTVASAASTKLGTMLAVYTLVGGLAGGALGGSAGYALGRHRATHEPVETSVVDRRGSEPVYEPAVPYRDIPDDSTTDAALSIAAPRSTAAEAPADVCASLPDLEPKECSRQKGKTVTFSLRSNCGVALDLFLVDETCREQFAGIVFPQRPLLYDTWDSNVYRLRDRATHRLVKEFTVPRVDGAPDRIANWRGPRTQLPLVTVSESTAVLPEAPPPSCLLGGGRAATLHVKNERANPIVVMALDSECRESGAWRVLPGDSFERDTSEGHAYRVRDWAGALLLEIPPTTLDTTTYLTVP